MLNERAFSISGYITLYRYLYMTLYIHFHMLPYMYKPLYYLITEKTVKLQFGSWIW